MRKHSNSLDVAKLAGVSQTTVSFVLNQRRGHSISAETRERVLQAAQQLQYRSNRLSNGVLRGDTGLIGVVSPIITDDYYAHILASISARCASDGQTVIFSPAKDHMNRTRDPLLSLVEYRVDGIICVCQEAIAAELSVWLEEITQKGIKCVVVDDHKLEGKVHCVVSDDVAGERSVVKHLASLGHRRIVHLAAGHDSSTAIERRMGFIAGMKDLGFDESALVIEGSSYAEGEGRVAARKILQSGFKPTAIIAANDTLAAEAVKELHSVGLRCPEDISVAGYGNTQVARALELTSVDQQPDEIGLEAVKSLHEQQNEHVEAGPTTIIDCRLVPRSSTRACN